MTDKQNFEKDINVPHKEQIIIDGINVVDCNYIIDHDPQKKQGTWGGAIHKGACKIYSKDCRHNPDCYFKQLARKTQECELLKKYKDVVDRLSDKQIILTNKDKMPELYENIKDLKLECYHKALEEIEKELKEDIYCESQECGCDDFEECLKCTKEHILDILNKAKGEKNERQ